MNKTLEEVLALIENDEAKNDVQALIEAERNKGKKKVEEKDKESLTRLHALKKAGYDPAKHGSVEEFADSIVNEIQQASETVATKDLSISELTTQLNELKTSINLERQEKVNAKINSKMTSEMVNQDIKGTEFVIPSLIQQGRATLDDEDGVLVDGKPLGDFVNDFKQEHPELVGTKVVPGNGDTGGERFNQIEQDELDAILDRL